MKRTTKLIGASLLAAAAGTGVVWAQSATQNVTITAAVPAFCKFESVSALTGDINIASSTLGTSSSTVTIAAGANASGVMQDWAFTFNAQATCNKASTLQIGSLGGGLKDGTPENLVSGVFLNRMDYQATGKWASSANASFTTSGAPINSPLRSVGAAATGNVTVDVSAVVNATSPLLAGSYSDTLRITISPQ